MSSRHRYGKTTVNQSWIIVTIYDDTYGSPAISNYGSCLTIIIRQQCLIMVNNGYWWLILVENAWFLGVTLTTTKLIPWPYGSHTQTTFAMNTSPTIYLYIYIYNYYCFGSDKLGQEREKVLPWKKLFPSFWMSPTSAVPSFNYPKTSWSSWMLLPGRVEDRHLLKTSTKHFGKRPTETPDWENSIVGSAARSLPCPRGSRTAWEAKLWFLWSKSWKHTNTKLAT